MGNVVGTLNELDELAMKLGRLTYRENKILKAYICDEFEGCRVSVEEIHYVISQLPGTRLFPNIKTKEDMGRFVAKLFGLDVWAQKNGESIDYEEAPVSNNYVCLGNMYVRYGAGLNYGIKRVKELTEDGRKHCTTPDRPSADAIYKSGTIFTALEIINTTKYGVWAKSPSGYICIKGLSGREYCKKA